MVAPFFAASLLLNLYVSDSNAFNPSSSFCASRVLSTPYNAITQVQLLNSASTTASEDAEYEYNEADFADYLSDYSTDNSRSESVSILDRYENYEGIGGFDLSPFEQHAREVFLTYAKQVSSNIDLDSDNLSSNEYSEASKIANSGILEKDIYSMLRTLDIDATKEEAETLHKYLDIDGDGLVTLDEFLPWYAEAVDAAQQTAIGFQNLVKSRRTIHKFDATEVDDGVLRRALECAIAAPNRKGTEPWRFIKLGKETVGEILKLREKLLKRDVDDGSGVGGSFDSWTEVPHWIVITYTRAAPDSGPDGKMQQREDFKSTCCAVQNFLLSMWSEGIGTKWTDGPIQRTKEFATICGIDLEKEKIAGVIWYGFAKGGLNRADAKWRRKGVEEVLNILP